MDPSYDLRSALGDVLPAAGPSRALAESLEASGFKADPKNNDMKELFDGLGVAATGGEERLGLGGAGAGAGPSASQVLLNYRKERKATREAAEKEAATRLAAGAGKGLEKSMTSSSSAAAGVGGVGMARAMGLGRQELDDAAADERHLRKVHQSKTAAKMTSKQKRRIKHGKQSGTSYEERYEGKVMNKTKRKNRMAAMKQMY